MRSFLALLVIAGAVWVFLMPEKGTTAACQPLPARVLGTYQRVDNRAWLLYFTVNCTYEARQHGTVEGGGDYLVTAADPSSGRFIVSNDRGCRQPGIADVPTPYTYTFEQGVLLLEPEGGMAADLCVDSHGEGRAQDLSDHGGWIKTIGGPVRIATKGAARGSFTTSGAFTDHGAYRMTQTKSTRRTKTASLRFAGEGGTFTLSERVARTGARKGKFSWRVVAGSGGYIAMVGAGTGTATGSRQSFRGDVSN
jgi:hypothetical protein